jgi:hypothetical protein
VIQGEKFNSLLGYKKMAGTSAVFLREDYDPATHGDLRRVDSIGEYFVYLEQIRGWVQVKAYTKT